MTNQFNYCSEGWAMRCSWAQSKQCNCACAGQNHGKKSIGRNTENTRFRIPNKINLPASKGKIIGLRIANQPGDHRLPVVYFDGEFLDPRYSQQTNNHSPDGFEWGYCGSGPSQLALAIALRICKNGNDALREYQDFKHENITGLDKAGFKLELSEVKKWFKNKLKNNS